MFRFGSHGALACRRAIAQTWRMGTPFLERYVVRPGLRGSRIVDVLTGHTAQIGQAAQDNLSDEDAEHTAKLLNARHAEGERRGVGP